MTEPLWPGGVPGRPDLDDKTGPSLTYYAADPKLATGACIVVCPGGGYWVHADHEGEPIAKWLNSLGIASVVLRYRLAPNSKHPEMINDAARAIRTVRSRAEPWKIDPNRVGILGFSAGGHLTSSISTNYDPGSPNAVDAIDRQSSRPDIAILLYAVISMREPYTHGGSRQALLGDNPSDELVDRLSGELQVTADTPPMFLFHTADDPSVPVGQCLEMAAALSKANVPFDLHIYEHGRHGVGLAEDDPILGTWPMLCAHWLRIHGFAHNV